jgi:putative flippase GtrA
MPNKACFTHLVKFVIVGASNTIISYIVFFTLYNKLLVGDAISSQCLSYAAGIIWTFSEHPNKRALLAPFVILQLMLLLISALALDIAKENLEWNINLIWVCIMAVSTAMNFVLSKYVVFKA